MGRRPNPQRKQDLLDVIIEYLGDHGIGDLSLRPLAKRLGTSTYTLTYQFGSKDQLLADAVAHAQAAQMQAVETWLTTSPQLPAAELLRQLWSWTLVPHNLRLVRMLLEATTLAHSQPDLFGQVGPQVVGHGVELIRQALQRDGVATARARGLATQVYATLVGLQVDLIATGDVARVSAVVEELAQSVAVADLTARVADAPTS